MNNKINKKFFVGLLFLSLILPLSSNVSFVRAEDEPVNFIMASQGLSGLTTLDPLTYYAAPEMDTIFVVSEGLVAWVSLEDGTTTIDPSLATTWEYVDSVTLDVDLREEVSFSDGTPWNATMCKWNWDRLYNLEMDPWVWTSFSSVINLPSDPYRDVTGVDLDWLPDGEYVYVINNTEIISEYKVRFNLNVPFDLINVLAPHNRMISPVAHDEYFYAPLPSSWVTNITDVLSEGLVGTGPYELEEINFVEETVTLNRNLDWWGPEPDIDVVTFRYFSGDPQTMSIALVAGDVDGCTFADRELLQDNDDIVYFEEPQVGVGNYIGMFPEKINFSVREAFNYAFDYQYFIDEILGGHGSMPTGAIFLDQTYQNDEINLPTYNLTKAQDILIESGIAPSSATGWDDDDWKDVADGDGLVSPLGNYTLGYMDLYGMADWATTMVTTARTIGINITLDQESEANFWGIALDRTGAAESWDMYTGMMGMSSTAEMPLLMMWQSAAAYPAAMPIGGDAEVDEAVWNFMTTPPDDSETRQGYADAVVELINELFVFTWIPSTPWACAYSTEWTDVASLIDFRPQYFREQSGFGKFIGQIPGYPVVFIFISSTLVVVSLMRKRKK